MSIFEKAVRKKLRFETSRGYLSVEDLWDLGVAELDGLFKPLNKELKEQDEESLLATPTKAKTELSLKVEVLKHIVTTMLLEKEARLGRAEKKAKRNQLLALMADKETDALKDKTIAELTKELEALDEGDDQ